MELPLKTILFCIQGNIIYRYVSIRGILHSGANKKSRFYEKPVNTKNAPKRAYFACFSAFFAIDNTFPLVYSRA